MMPTISIFYGIAIQMYYDDHNPPHIHAKFSDNEALYDFDGNVLRGSIPHNKEILVKAWLSLHKEDLAVYWEMGKNGETIPSMSIDPLK
jgi:hypothetical protein